MPTTQVDADVAGIYLVTCSHESGSSNSGFVRCIGKMNRRKEIINEYKERKSCGGVYIITNTLNGKYLIDHAANLKSIQNRFQFAVATGSTVHPKLRKDWEELGAKAFTLEVLE